MPTFGTFKSDIRSRLWPAGEAPQLVAAHDKAFIDALIDLQTVVACLQSDNTNIVPQCSTFYDCQTTVLQSPRGNIKSVSVIDKIDPTTCLENPAVADDYCQRIYYNQIDPCHMRAWRSRWNGGGCGTCAFPALPLFFGFPSNWCQPMFPPTDAGLPAGLPPLPMGIHYAQTSTDRMVTNQNGTTRWRARHGLWAIERGKIILVPYIQSTETIIIVWDGLKRTWSDDDAVDEDPLLSQAVEEYVRWMHADKYDQDPETAVRAATNFASAKAALIHQCREETRVRECETSHARGSVSSLTTLFYNAQQRASGTCPDGSNPISVTIPAGSVSSTVSVADANQLALNEANNQVQARLASLCAAQGNTFQNAAQTATVSCQGEEGAPPPDGAPVTVTIPAGTVTSTVSQADADQQAFILAQVQASSQLRCIFWNKTVSQTFSCPSNPLVSTFITVAAHTHSSTISQADADAKGIDDLNNQGAAWIAAHCAGTLFWNTPQTVHVGYHCPTQNCNIVVNVTVAAHVFSASTQQAANDLAIIRANQYGTQYAVQQCQAGQCGQFNIPFGG